MIIENIKKDNFPKLAGITLPILLSISNGDEKKLKDEINIILDKRHDLIHDAKTKLDESKVTSDLNVLVAFMHAVALSISHYHTWS